MSRNWVEAKMEGGIVTLPPHVFSRIRELEVALTEAAGVEHYTAQTIKEINAKQVRLNRAERWRKTARGANPR